MNKHILALAVVAALSISGCSTTKSPSVNNDVTVPSDTKVAVKDRVVAAHFRDRGIELHYTWGGELEKAIVWGVAQAWQPQFERMAELDAKQKLVKFLHGETVTSETRQEIIGRALEKARDNTLNRFDSNTSQDADFSFDAATIEAEIQREPAATNQDNTSRRIAERVERTLINTAITLRSEGRLVGVIKIDDGRSRDGRYYFAKYEWSPKTSAASEMMRGRMQ
jgi:hypothetical protein